MSFSGCRLEKNGTVVVYFAPASTITPNYKNDLFNQDTNGQGTVIRDKNMWHHEVVVQGDFQHGSNLPVDHQNALSGIFSQAGDTVTAKQQFNRLAYYAQEAGGGFSLYDFGDEYTEDDYSTVDIQAGKFPKVYIDELSPTHKGGSSEIAYTVKFLVGVGTV